MPRESIKTDYTEDEIKNLEAKKCWCGKPRSEFDKGMRVYCCADHRHQWYMRTETWSSFKDRFLQKEGKQCAKCGCTPESLKKDEKSEYKDWLKLVKNSPEAMKIIQQARIQKLDDIENIYQQVMDDDYLIKWELGYRNSEKIDGVPPVPKEDSFIESRFEVDHVLAISLGGDEWDENNLQILCYADHKIKTKSDMSKLKAKRRGLKPIVENGN